MLGRNEMHLYTILNEAMLAETPDSSTLQGACVRETAKRRICIVATGCHENYMDAALLRRYLGEECEFEISESYTDADIILFLGCSVTQHMEQESYDLMECLNEQKRRETKLFVMGCISKVRPELRTKKMGAFIPIRAIEGLLRMDKNAKKLAVNAPYKNTAEISNLLATRKQRIFQLYTGVSEKGVFPGVSSAVFNVLFSGLQKYKEFVESRINVYDDKTFCIKISTGCLGECSYCSIRQSRGKIKSKAIDEIMAEFQRGLDQGYQQFALLGTDIGDYGKDLGVDLIHLLERMVALKARFRLKLRNVNPRWLIPSYRDLCDLLTSHKIIYIASPVQSGNDRILELMKRGYRAEDFVQATGEIHRRFPFLVLRTQIIAGFPTEKDEEFEDSVSIMDTGNFDYVDVFRYTKRPHTSAASISPLEEVPFEVIMRRYRRLFFKALLKHPVRTVRAIYRLR